MSGAEPPILYLMRHGETAFNREGRYQGQRDSPLTELGVQQAVAVSEMLAGLLRGTSVRIIASPLGRALRTAEILAETLGTNAPETDDRLMEVGMGAWDGLTRAEIAERWPDARRGHGTREWMFHGPGGETLEALGDRLWAALEDAKATEGAVPILVAHAVSGRILRAIHAGLGAREALTLDAPQDAAFAFRAGGRIDLVATEAYRARSGQSDDQGFQP